MNCNLACSPAQAGSEQRPCPQGSLFPILAFPPLSLHTHTHTQNPTMTVGGSLEEPGRELQCVVLCSVSMRVYVNFLFYGGSSLHMYRSLFRCSVWEKKKKKVVSNSHESVICMGRDTLCFWETALWVEGSRCNCNFVNHIIFILLSSQQS